MTKNKKFDIYQTVTDKIIASLEAGVVPWKKSWYGGKYGSPANFVSKRHYHGINAMLLGMSGYGSPYWLTYKQAQGIGAQVRKGEKSSMVVYWNFFESKEEDANGKKKVIPFLKYFSVFNVEQCDGIEVPEVEEKLFNPIEEAESMVTNYKNKPEIVETPSDNAFYSPIHDKISTPLRTQFGNEEEFYSTLFHEMVHSTGHKERLDRLISTMFGSDEYSKEELVAEIGAAFLCNMVGIAPKVEDNSVAYISSWLSKLRNDNRLIISAAGLSQKAVDYISGVKVEKNEEAA